MCAPPPNSTPPRHESKKAGSRAVYAKTSAAGLRVQDAAFVLKWRLSSLSTSSASGETGTYPVGQTKCLSVASVPGAADGVALAPVVNAILGEEIKASEDGAFR